MLSDSWEKNISSTVCIVGARSVVVESDRPVAIRTGFLSFIHGDRARLPITASTREVAAQISRNKSTNSIS